MAIILELFSIWTLKCAIILKHMYMLQVYNYNVFFLPYTTTHIGFYNRLIKQLLSFFITIVISNPC
jgi:hypothetical protein